jgi:hypothetical protein
MDEGVRLWRELSEILRRKNGCQFQRLYRGQDEQVWLACSEWTSLAELGGARRELARSPLYRRLHATLELASERAYQPFGSVQSSRGAGAAQALIVITLAQWAEDGEERIRLLSDLIGHLNHVLMRAIAEPGQVYCLAQFASAGAASEAVGMLSQAPGLQPLQPSFELFVS